MTQSSSKIRQTEGSSQLAALLPLKLPHISIWLIFMVAVYLAGSLQTTDADETNAFHINRLLGRGINFGNALEATREGDWGVILKAEYFDAVKAAGFKSVRIPVRWSAHAAVDPPYQIDSTFFDRVDWVIDQALSRGLVAVIDIHHYGGMYKEPTNNLPRLIALWRQIAAHYRNWPEGLLFELLNEPRDQLTDELWQEIMPVLLKVVRETNPLRAVIVGPAFWNSLNSLEKLSLPEDDHRLIATFHYYQPFRFTHQGAAWVKDSRVWKGTTWVGSPAERETLEDDFTKAANWAEKNHRSLYVGEFGAYEAADMDSRALWTAAVARAAEKRGFSWAYWEFCSSFGAYDQKTKMWREPLLRALTHQQASP